jgi:cyclopropane fatty-acyl-phospholipid synthase-like methyltransferase
VARLEAQGAAFVPATRIILAEAGIWPGMRVLDLGCGAGDATFVAADVVGSGGSVVGVDHSPQALARAGLRAGQRGLAQVQFIEGYYYDPAPDGPYDAIEPHRAATAAQRGCPGWPRDRLTMPD